MSETSLSSTAAQERWVTTERGRLYTKRWMAPARTDAAPIVLFHDSLGCVTLWRDFPDQLAHATARDVIAYDRLGFGRSDPHPGVLRDDFIHDEATGDFSRVKEQLGITGFVAFGHSVGGGMAVGCAATHGDCRALVTESAQAFVEEGTVNGILEAKARFEQPGQRDRLRKYHDDKASWVLHAWTDTWLAPGFARWNLDEDWRVFAAPCSRSTAIAMNSAQGFTPSASPD